MAPVANKDLIQANGTVPSKDVIQKDGTSKSGKVISQNRLEEADAKSSAAQSLSPEHDIVLKTFRILIADLCQQFGGGHPGGAIGMAAIGVALWKYVMRYAPQNPDFFNRDRFVLSNGHTCLFQYTFLHLTGYSAMTFDQLKSYHSARTDSFAPGHPEIEHEGIEVTTGPLGQGIANAVGLAMASKHLAAEYNRPDCEVVDNHIWCMIGDACLQEGVALEAISFAGHLKLNNLTVMYDNNQITCDGSVDLTNTEDVNTKMRACGWDVIDIHDGCFDIDGIVKVLNQARTSKEKPTFINIRTIIGLGSAVAGDALSHGAAFGVADVADMKRAVGFNPEEHFVVSDEVRDFFADTKPRGAQLMEEYDQRLQKYAASYPDLAAEFERRRHGELGDWESLIPTEFPNKELATRASSGQVFNPIAAKNKSFMVGTADLSPSVNMIWKDKEDFQNPELRTQCGIRGSYKGRYIHYGIREHAMAAIANGLAAYCPGSIIPVTSSFFMFYIYAAPAVRMGALQYLQVIHVATHDSIGTGEDGPTHQPIELAALYRAMPNLLYIRPGDSEETAGAWISAIKAKRTPSIISTSRHKVPQQPLKTNRHSVAKGAYVLEEISNPDLTIIGVGAELCLAVDTAQALSLAPYNLRVRVVSFPCQRLFEQQPLSYRRQTLLRGSNVPRVVIEPYSSNGWERYADAALCMSLNRFGKSLPGHVAYEYFGFTVENACQQITGFLKDRKAGQILEFVELVTRE